MHLKQRLIAEFLGTAILLATVVGSGIMGERLAGGNVAIALLTNTIATGAMLTCLILTFGKISSHFNPAVTAVSALHGQIMARCLSDTFAGIRPQDVAGFIGAQAIGAALAAMVFHWFNKGEQTA